VCFRSELVAAMTSIGNNLANSVWEASLKGRVKPSPSTHRFITFIQSSKEAQQVERLTCDQQVVGSPGLPVVAHLSL